jgi:hypothetical protein
MTRSPRPSTTPGERRCWTATPRLAGKDERTGEKELRRKIRERERALGRKTYELEVAGEGSRGWE